LYITYKVKLSKPAIQDPLVGTADQILISNTFGSVSVPFQQSIAGTLAAADGSVVEVDRRSNGGTDISADTNNLFYIPAGVWDVSAGFFIESCSIPGAYYLAWRGCFNLTDTPIEVHCSDGLGQSTVPFTVTYGVQPTYLSYINTGTRLLVPNGRGMYVGLFVGASSGAIAVNNFRFSVTAAWPTAADAAVITPSTADIGSRLAAIEHKLEEAYESKEEKMIVVSPPSTPKSSLSSSSAPVPTVKSGAIVAPGRFTAKGT